MKFLNPFYHFLSLSKNLCTKSEYLFFCVFNDFQTEIFVKWMIASKWAKNASAKCGVHTIVSLLGWCWDAIQKPTISFKSQRCTKRGWKEATFTVVQYLLVPISLENYYCYRRSTTPALGADDGGGGGGCLHWLLRLQQQLLPIITCVMIVWITFTPSLKAETLLQAFQWRPCQQLSRLTSNPSSWVPFGYARTLWVETREWCW